jgi:L-alanine-DL-glutamate epimerase-like enolase superfamily enzyme
MISRRNFLGAMGLATAGALAPSAGRAQEMPTTAKRRLGQVKITDVKTAAIDIRYKTHLVKVTTDSGLYGLGEAFPKGEVADDIHLVKDKVIGQDPLQVEVLHEGMTAQYMSRGSRTGALCGAIGGIETALWDLAGKILGVPVYVLLGGAYRSKVLLYNDTDSPKEYDPRAWAEMALESKELGYRAVKHSLPGFDTPKNGTISAGTLRKWTRIMEETRNLLGPDFPIGMDLHWKYHTVDVLRFTEMIEDLNLWFLEDPIQPEDVDGSLRLTQESSVPILTGENLYSRHGFKPYIENQACDMIHPDPQKCGGLLETKKIADWADLYSMPTVCHNGASPVGTIASAHACMAIRTAVALETDTIERSRVPHWQDIIVRDGPLYKDGYLEVSDRPGLGIELNEEVCRAHLADDRGFFE